MTSLTDDLFAQLEGAPLQQISQQLGIGRTQAAGAVSAAGQLRLRAAPDRMSPQLNPLPGLDLRAQVGGEDL